MFTNQARECSLHADCKVVSQNSEVIAYLGYSPLYKGSLKCGEVYDFSRFFADHKACIPERYCNQRPIGGTGILEPVKCTDPAEVVGAIVGLIVLCLCCCLCIKCCRRK